jgi:hypothetical protein
MKKALTLSVAFLVLGAALASAGTSKAVSHAKASHGTIQSVDMASKSFVLKTGDKEMKVTWNDATRVTGGQLKDGEQVELRSVEKDGTHVATAIQIEPLKPAKTTK